MRQLTEKEDRELQNQARKIVQIFFVDRPHFTRASEILYYEFNKKVDEIYDDEIKRRKLIPFNYKSLPDYLGMSIDRRNAKIEELKKAGASEQKINTIRESIKADIK